MERLGSWQERYDLLTCSTGLSRESRPRINLGTNRGDYKGTPHPKEGKKGLRWVPGVLYDMAWQAGLWEESWGRGVVLFDGQVATSSMKQEL